MTTSILNLKAWEIDVDATQKKFDENWKTVCGNDEKVDLQTFYEWAEKIKKPLALYDRLSLSYKRTHNQSTREQINALKATDEYKLATKFVACNWSPVCTDLGKMIRTLVDRVETLESEVQSLRERVWMAEKSSE